MQDVGSIGFRVTIWARHKVQDLGITGSGGKIWEEIRFRM